VARWKRPTLVIAKIGDDEGAKPSRKGEARVVGVAVDAALLRAGIRRAGESTIVRRNDVGWRRRLVGARGENENESRDWKGVS
jgi:hypothetical protein